MSEALPIEFQAPTEVDSPTITAVIDLLKRLASLKGEFGELVEVPLDATLTTDQMARWLQLTAKEVNSKAKKGVIPAIPINAAKSRFRFHPRSVIERGQSVYAKRNL